MFDFKNYPFFIWECEGNGVYYTFQILFKLIFEGAAFSSVEEAILYSYIQADS